MTMNRILILLTLVLIFAGAAGGQSPSARDRLTGDRADPISVMFGPGVSLLGVQNNPGTYDFLNDKCWGNTFVLNGSGEWFTSHLTVTMDYISGQPNPDSGNMISYGTWTMTIYKEGAYFGTVYGEVASGDILWRTNPKTGLIDGRNTDAYLRILGTVDGMSKVWQEPGLLRLNADTRLDGVRAVTTATLDSDF